MVTQRAVLQRDFLISYSKHLWQFNKFGI